MQPFLVINVLILCSFFFFFFQLSIIEPIKRDVLDARNAINMGDFPGAIEFLGRAIEVIFCI